MLWVALISVTNAVLSVDPPDWNTRDTSITTMHVGIIAPLTNHPCGPSRYVSMRMAADHVNQRDSQICPAIANLDNNFQITYELFDTTGNARGAVGAALKSVEGTGGRPGAKAILGPNSSGSSMSASDVLSLYDVPHVSWAATSADLTNTEHYPNFFRVVPPDSSTMMALAKFLVSLGYMRATVVYFDPKFQSGQARDFMAAAGVLGMEIAGSFKIPAWEEAISNKNRADIEVALEGVKALENWVVCLFAYGAEGLEVMKTAHEKRMVRNGWAWFGADGTALNFGMTDESTAEDTNPIVGSMHVMSDGQSSRFPDFENIWNTEVRNINTPEFDTNAICGTKQDTVCNTLDPVVSFKGWSVGAHDEELACKGYTGLGYDAMISFAVAFDRMITDGKITCYNGETDEECITEATWMEYLKAMSSTDTGFECLTNGRVFFDENQERPLPSAVFYYEYGNKQARKVAKIDENGVVTWCADAGLDCSFSNIAFPYDAATEQPERGVIARGSPPSCATEEVYDRQTDTCVSCEVQQYFNTTTGQCVTCSEGYYCPVGYIEPHGCSAGYGGFPICATCPAGQQSSEGREACSDCPAGLYSDAGAGECIECRRGTYVEETGSLECTPCRDGFVTLGTRSSSRDACICPLGYYFDNNDCQKCGEGLLCPGGNEIPLVAAGYYAETSEMKGGTMELLVWQCAYGKVACPGDLLATEYGMVLEMEDARRVGECGGDLLTINGCSRCPDGEYNIFQSCDYCGDIDDEELAELCKRDCVSEDSTGFMYCTTCDPGNQAMFPIFVIVLVMLIYGVYRLTSTPNSQALTGGLLMSSLVGILLTHAQTLSVMGAFDLDLPPGLKEIFMVLRVLIFDIEVVNAICVTGTDFGKRYMSRIFVPLLLVTMFYLTMGLSRVLGKALSFIKPMDSSKTINALGLTVSAAYITLCKLSFQFFECREHPAADRTLVSFPDITCYSDQHMQFIPAAFFAILVYVCGILFAFVYIVYQAPTKYSESDYRIKTRFLVYRWKPTVWWFGPMVMIRNLALALVGVLYPSKAFPQLAWTASITASYAVLQQRMSPWRDWKINTLDGLLNLCISVFSIFVLIISKGEKYQQRRKDYTFFVYFFFAISIAEIVFLLTYGVKMMIKGGTQITSGAQTYDQIKRLHDCMASRGEFLPTDQLKERLDLVLTYDEQLAIQAGISITLEEVFNVESPRSHTNRLSMSNKEQRGQVMRRDDAIGGSAIGGSTKGLLTPGKDSSQVTVLGAVAADTTAPELAEKSSETKDSTPIGSLDV